MGIATVKTFITYIVEVELVVMDTITATVVHMELRVEVVAIATVKTFIMYIVEVSTVEFLCQEAIAPMLHQSFLLSLLLEIQ